jgi:hypothetical protein
MVSSTQSCQHWFLNDQIKSQNYEYFVLQESVSAIFKYITCLGLNFQPIIIIIFSNDEY